MQKNFFVSPSLQGARNGAPALRMRDGARLSACGSVHGREVRLYFPGATSYTSTHPQPVSYEVSHVACSPSFFRHDLTPPAVGLYVPVTDGGVARIRSFPALPF